VNQVSLRSANSAGLQDISGLQERLDFQGAVWIDTINGGPAVVQDHPYGTPSLPGDNFADAVAIANRFAIHEIQLFAGGLTTPITCDVDISGFDVHATTPGQSIFFSAGNNVNGSRFERLYLDGDFGGTELFYGDYVGFYGGTTGVRGIFTESLLLPNPDALGDNRVFLSGDFSCLNLGSGVPGALPAQISGANLTADANLQVIGFTGGLEVSDFGTSDTKNVDFKSG
jgi:hypothetical protein